LSVVASQVLWTVGHSNHGFDALAALLARERIAFVADVRSYPYSRHAPQFNRENLEAALCAGGVRYLFLGEALGGRPTREEHYDAEGHALYDAMAAEREFGAAIDRLLAGSREHRIALLCSEADPHDCHRRLLVGKVLAERGVELRHILRDGSVLTEQTVDLSAGQPPSLFGEDEQPWRSTRSVSHRRRLSGSSAV
jgi:uncharacterized protein (DUF488 family)